MQIQIDGVFTLPARSAISFLKCAERKDSRSLNLTNFWNHMNKHSNVPKEVVATKSCKRANSQERPLMDRFVRARPDPARAESSAPAPASIASGMRYLYVREDC
jgi:hypothetical protein